MSTLLRAQLHLDRDGLARRYQRNRGRSKQIFELVDPAAFGDRPIPLRHPFVFYEGHIPAFSFFTLNGRSLQQEPVDVAFEKLFERGIDPAGVDAAANHARSDWPTRAQVAAFAARCDDRVLDAIAHARLADDTVPRLVRAQSTYAILEHEEMHHETLVYIVHQLDEDRKGRIAQTHHDAPPPRNEMIAIPRGTATLGADPEAIAFGWDNEFGEHAVDVPAFSIAKYPVTNADWLAYVRAGGPPAPFWVQRDGEWRLRGVFEELPLPLSWPVYATHEQAEAYARAQGKRLPSEAEYHRAAFGTPTGEERSYPWGDDAPLPMHGNFDFERYDPEPVDAHPAGVSAFGVYDLIGNGWEWTSTVFGPFPGFSPMASYPQYSADFFDGKHYVMKGASPVTASDLIRRSFRNWFYGDYPYVYTKFRVAD
jgi:formylglycine-generating enzyme required for sulfatase activity